jgi:hypothetical protein
MKRFLEIIVKLGIDLAIWAWATALLAKAAGWGWNRMALVTCGIAMLVNSLKS